VNDTTSKNVFISALQIILPVVTVTVTVTAVQSVSTTQCTTLDSSCAGMMKAVDNSFNSIKACISVQFENSDCYKRQRSSSVVLLCHGAFSVV
jgi:hypothetical protein